MISQSKVLFGNDFELSSLEIDTTSNVLKLEGCKMNIPLRGIPATKTKVWTIYKSDLTLTLECNGLVVGKFDFHDATGPTCVNRWRDKPAKYIQFEREDNDPIYMRTMPGKTGHA